MFVQKMSVIQKWEGYKNNGSKSNGDKPLFLVRKSCKVFGKDLSCKVTVKSDNGQAIFYRLEGLASKSALRIIDSEGKLVAEVIRPSIFFFFFLLDLIIFVFGVQFQFFFFKNTKKLRLICQLGFVQAKRKQLSSGVVLGDDVLTMVMETQMDHSLIMALVTVYGLIRRKI